MPDSRGRSPEGRGPADPMQAGVDPARHPEADRRRSSVPSQDLVGHVISGRYRVVERIATGGMSTVYRGEHIHMLKHVAIKVLDPKAERLPELVQRFQREAIAGAHVQHPNIASATDFGQLEDGSYFLVLEYVSGTSLNHVIAEGPLPVERAVRIGRQVAAALQAAHSLSIVHRDVKPSNIMLLDGQNDVVKLIDFGLAQVRVDQVASIPVAPGRSSIEEPLTGVGIVFGTVAYMAPEASLGMASVDLRSDLYALGIILYEMLAGRHPFDGNEPVQLFLQHRTTPPPPIAMRTPGVTVPPAVEAVIARLLEKDPRLRYQSAADVVGALDGAMLRAATGMDSDMPVSAPRGQGVSSSKTAALAAVLAEPSDGRATLDMAPKGRLHAPEVEGFALAAPDLERTIEHVPRGVGEARAAEAAQSTAAALGQGLPAPPPPPPPSRQPGLPGIPIGLPPPGPRLPSFADEPSAPGFPQPAGMRGAHGPSRSAPAPATALPPPDPLVPPPLEPAADSRSARIDSDALPTLAIGASEVLRHAGSEAAQAARKGRASSGPRQSNAREATTDEGPSARRPGAGARGTSGRSPAGPAAGGRAPTSPTPSGRSLPSRAAWLANLPVARPIVRAFREHPAAGIGLVVGAAMLVLLAVVALTGRRSTFHLAPADSAAGQTKAEPDATASGSANASAGASAAPPEASGSPSARSGLDELEADVYKTTLRNSSKAKDWNRGAAAVVSLLKLEPTCLHDKDLSAAMLVVAVGVGQTDGEPQDRFFHDLARDTGTPGLDALYEMARWRAWTKAGKRAKDALRAADVAERMPTELRVLFDFYQASCMGKRALFNRMAEEGDARALTELVVLREAQCTRWRDPCCFQENRELTRAIGSLRARLATHEKSN